MNSTMTDDSWDIPENSQSNIDPLLACLAILTRHYGNPYSPESLISGLPLDKGTLTPDLFIRAAERARVIFKAY